MLGSSDEELSLELELTSGIYAQDALVYIHIESDPILETWGLQCLLEVSFLYEAITIVIRVRHHYIMRVQNAGTVIKQPS